MEVLGGMWVGRMGERFVKEGEWGVLFIVCGRVGEPYYSHTLTVAKKIGINFPDILKYYMDI